MVTFRFAGIITKKAEQESFVSCVFGLQMLLAFYKLKIWETINTHLCIREKHTPKWTFFMISHI